MSNKIIKLGIPKGSLEKATIEIFKNAGWNIKVSPRNYFPSIDDADFSCCLIRAQEMARYVAGGILDVGLTGLDWILESGEEVNIISDLIYSKASKKKARWVLAVTNDSSVRSIEDLSQKTISTELVNFTKKYFAERNIPVRVEFSWGATEAKVVEGIVDAIVEVTETETTLKANGLRIIETLLETNTKLIANPLSIKDQWKKEKIQQLSLLLRGALNAENMMGLKMNVPKERLEDVVKRLPCITAPTIAQLYNTEWFSVETVINESIAREIIPKLIQMGADGIIEYSLNKVVGRDDLIY